MTATRRLLSSGAALSVGAIAAVNAYLAVLLAAAVRDALRPSSPRGGSGLRAAVLVPAHDEEAMIGATVAALAQLGERPEVIVVADNCSDGTARVAAEAGATVWTRDEPDRRGKGAALRWGFDRLLAERPDLDAVVVVDADCQPSANLVTAVAARLGAGARSVQVVYLVANPEESAATALRYAAFASWNHVRPRGRTALGLSAGLLGTGMAFRLEVLRRVPWEAGGLVEDLEQHVRLVEAGERVDFAPEAAVTSPIPATERGGDVQQSRWERGRLEVARRHAPRLVADGLRRRDVRRLAAAVDLLIPPQSILAAASLVTAGAAAVLRMPRAAALAGGCLVSQGVLAVGGLALVRAPAAAYAGLLGAPALVLGKLRVYLRIARGRGPSSWERTPREAVRD